MGNRIIVILVIISVVIFASPLYFQGGLSPFLPYVGLISFFFAISQYVKNKDEKKRKKEDLVEISIKPVIAPLITRLKTMTENIPQSRISELGQIAEQNVRDETDIIPTILLACYKFSELLKVEDTYRKAFSLALAYKLAIWHDVQNGEASREIDSKIRKNSTIRCGDKVWKLTNNEVQWYTRFSESDNLLSHSFSMVYQEVRDLDAVTVQNSRDETQIETKEIKEYFKDKDKKFQKLMMLISKKIPNVDFLKILVSLRTSIVLISKQGISSASDRAFVGSQHDTGSKYLKQVFKELGLNMVRLNNSVDFAFLKDIVPKEQDYRYFNLQQWGQQIAKKADDLRQSDKNGHDRKFNFVVLKSSLDELRSFGDELGDESRIKIPPEMLTNLGVKEMNMSTLLTIAKLLRQFESTSIVEFIDRHLEYLEGINDESVAKVISETLMKNHDKKEWRISDFKKFNITKEELISAGLAEEQAKNIIEEALAITQALSLS